MSQEIKLGRIGGPYTQPPCQPFISSPIGLVPKRNPGSFRLIHHLSHPNASSVNDGIPQELRTVQYTSVGHAIKTIKAMGADCHLAKSDIKQAYRLLPIKPSVYGMLIFCFQEKFIVDRCLPMGLSFSCRIY